MAGTDELKRRRVADLRAYLKAQGVRVPAKARKADLIALINGFHGK